MSYHVHRQVLLILKMPIKHTAKFTSTKFKSYVKYLSIEKSDYWANIVDQDKVAHYEPPHLDLRCLRMQLVCVMPASGMARYHDPVFHPFVHLSINICDHPSVNPTVQVCNSERF